MIEKLKIEKDHQGFVFLYTASEHRLGMCKSHRHKELEMNIVIKGSAAYILPQQRYALSPGTIVWLFPGQEHQLAGTDPDFEMYVIVFKEELFKNILLLKEKYNALTEQNPAGSFCRRVSLSSIEKLKPVCQSLCELNAEEVISPAYHYAGQAFGFETNAAYHHADPVLLNAGLSYLMTVGWHLFLTEGADEKRKVLNPSVKNPSVKKAVDLLKAYPQKDYSLSRLSVECGVSPSRLSRLFNEQIGLSIVDFKNQLKLDHFMSCLQKNPDYSISEACYTVGFGSYSQFYKTFKQTFGISPKAYFSQPSPIH